MKPVFLGLLLASLAPSAALPAADAVGKAAKDATHGWQNAPAEIKAFWQRHKDALKMLLARVKANRRLVSKGGVQWPGFKERT